MNWEAIATTLKLATLTSIILMILGLPLAYWVAFSKWRWKFLVEATVALPLVLPPTVLGFYVLVAMGPQSPLGRWYQSLAGHGLPFTFEGLVVASVLYSLPFAVQPIAAAFGSVDRKLIEASWMLGVSDLETFFRVIVPQSALRRRGRRLQFRTALQLHGGGEHRSAAGRAARRAQCLNPGA